MCLLSSSVSDSPECRSKLRCAPAVAPKRDIGTPVRVGLHPEVSGLRYCTFRSLRNNDTLPVHVLYFGQRAPLRRESRCIDSGSHCRHPPAGIDMDSCGNAQCPHKDKRGGDNQTSPCHRKVASYAQSAASQYQVIEHFLRLSY